MDILFEWEARTLAGAASGDGGTADPLWRAHQAMLRHGDLQFDFPGMPPQRPPPAWLVALEDWIGKALLFMAPAVKYVFWGGLIVIAGLILFFIGREVFGLFKGRSKTKIAGPELDGEWRPTEARACALLEDADRLAAEGRFDEAAHLLLLRSIEDIDARWPRLVRPALTSRDIAAHQGLPAAARETFSYIARIVERSLFGGARLEAADFNACRGAYEAFAAPVRP